MLGSLVKTEFSVIWMAIVLSSWSGVEFFWENLRSKSNPQSQSIFEQAAYISQYSTSVDNNNLKENSFKRIGKWSDIVFGRFLWQESENNSSQGREIRYLSNQLIIGWNWLLVQGWSTHMQVNQLVRSNTTWEISHGGWYYTTYIFLLGKTNDIEVTMHHPWFSPPLSHKSQLSLKLSSSRSNSRPIKA